MREEAGLQAGDIVTQINDTTVSNGSDLINAVANFSPGDTVTLTVNRNGETLTLQVTLDESTRRPKRSKNRPNKATRNSGNSSRRRNSKAAAGPSETMGTDYHKS